MCLKAEVVCEVAKISALLGSIGGASSSGRYSMRSSFQAATTCNRGVPCPLNFSLGPAYLGAFLTGLGGPRSRMMASMLIHSSNCLPMASSGNRPDLSRLKTHHRRQFSGVSLEMKASNWSDWCPSLTEMKSGRASRQAVTMLSLLSHLFLNSFASPVRLLGLLARLAPPGSAGEILARGSAWLA